MEKSLELLPLTIGLSKEPPRVLVHEKLVSVRENLRLGDWSVSSDEIEGSGAGNWSIRKKTLHGGRQEGVELVEVQSGPLKIVVIPTRGMGILDVTSGGVRLGWDSPVKEVVHPNHINLPSRGGLGWVEGFNEWLVRCGLEYAGAPGKDKFITNTGDESEMDLTLHGKIANIPASEVEVVVEAGDPPRIRIRGRVEESLLFGPKLELLTEISTEVGSNRFRVLDQITNLGGCSQEFELIYHLNFGPPLLEDGSRFVGAMKRVTPINDYSAGAVDGYDRYSGPKQNFIEEVYCMVPWGDGDGRTRVMLQNRARDRSVSLDYSIDQMPFFTLWKNLSDVRDGYVTGLEPATSLPHNRSVERRMGRLPQLSPGQSRQFVIDFAIQMGEEEVSRVEEKIRVLQSKGDTEVSQKPDEMI